MIFTYFCKNNVKL